jgi:hypothetical protein
MIEQIFPDLLGGGGWINHLIFYRIPKNASTSIFNHLGAWNLLKKYEKLFQQNADKRLYRNWFDPTHAKPDEAYRVFKRGLEKYFSFCIARNPWDRAVSIYHFTEKEHLYKLYGFSKDTDFKTYCEILLEHKNNPYFIATNKQVDWLKGYCPPKEILRFENLNEDFSNMLKNYNITHISDKLPHLNSTKHSNYRDYYSSETKKIIANVFEEDIDTLKYTFD